MVGTGQNLERERKITRAESGEKGAVAEKEGKDLGKGASSLPSLPAFFGLGFY